jgi:hypothetical protein
MTTGSQYSDHNVTRFHKKIQYNNKKFKDKTKFRVKVSKDGKKSSRRISGETKYLML